MKGRWGFVVWIFAAILVVPSGGTARAGTILTPRDGRRFAGSAGWLVVASEGPVGVRLDGKPVSVGPKADSVRHFRLSPLQPRGSKVTVSTRDLEATLTLYGGASDIDPFHREAPEACTSCHGWDRAGCPSCHPGSKRPAHTALRKGDCARCHGGGAAPVPEKVCEPCHRGFARRHPRLGHSVSAPSDPLRPGRPLDCISCHDPHAPAPLGAQKPSERRAWCRGCHTR